MVDKYDDNIQHGIDDDPNNDPEKARNIGGVGGAVAGAIAGSAAGPLGTIGGAVVGAVVGGIASKQAVKVVDRYDNDDTITGIGHSHTHDVIDTPGNGVPGVQTGGHAIDGTPDTRGVMEKTADTLTGDKYDDKTGKRIDNDGYNAGYNTVGNGVPGVQTGGHAIDGTPDTRGVMEKSADTVTGDKYDDKTGKRIDDASSTYSEHGNGIPGVQTGGHAADGTPDTRGITEKVADKLTGDRIDDKTSKPVV